MARSFISPSRSTNRTINAIDRKRERERRFMLRKAREMADELALKLVQRLLDHRIVDTVSDRDVRETVANELRRMDELEEGDFQYKIAPLRGLVPDPNLVSLYVTQFITEDLVEHPSINEIYGDDLEIYRVVDSVLGVLRPH